MIKNFALASLTVVLLILFSGYIKEGIFEARAAITLRGIEIEDEAGDRLSAMLDRVGDGYRGRVYTQVERIALEEMMAELRSYKGKEMPEEAAEKLSNRFEIITDRHGL